MTALYAKKTRMRKLELRIENWCDTDLVSVSEVISISGAKMGCRDPDDDKFLELALLGDADCLVTGDQVLLEMIPFRGVDILKPVEFLSLFPVLP